MSSGAFRRRVFCLLSIDWTLSSSLSLTAYCSRCLYIVSPPFPSPCSTASCLSLRRLWQLRMRCNLRQPDAAQSLSALIWPRTTGQLSNAYTVYVLLVGVFEMVEQWTSLSVVCTVKLVMISTRNKLCTKNNWRLFYSMLPMTRAPNYKIMLVYNA